MTAHAHELAPWDIAAAALAKRGVALDADGVVKCPTCAQGSLLIRREPYRLMLRCFSGCSALTSMRALGLEPRHLVEELEEEAEAENRRRRMNGATPLHLLSAQDFAGDEPPDALVERMLFLASVQNLVGATKVGKSFLAYQLAICVATGVPFLGLEVRKARVLLVSLELSAGLVRKRMESICRGGGLRMPRVGEELFIAAPTRHASLSLDLGCEEGRKVLAEAIEDTGAELVILDTLYRFLPGLDPKDNGEMGVAFAGLTRLAQESGAAILSLDHTAKGESLGPVPQAGLGAQIKGGASAAVLSLKRTAREDGGRWALDCESWFGSWDEPIYFERPKLPGGERGDGCLRCGAAEGFTLSREKIEELFRKFGELGDDGRPRFSSTRKLVEALKTAGYATGNEQAETIVGAIRREHSAPEGARFGFDRPITTKQHGNGRTSPTEWRWRHDPQPREDWN